MTPPAQSEIATASTFSSAAQLAALLQGIGVSRLDQMGWIRVTGKDRVRWLNGMVTNSIQQLKDGEGNYNFLLSVQGRIQGDATIFAEPDALLIETAASQVPTLTTLLDHYIIMDDVELADATGSQSGLLVAGPKATSLLAMLSLNVEDLGTLQKRTMPWNGAQISVLHTDSPLIPRFELWADANTTRLSKTPVLRSARRKASNGCGSSREHRSMAPISATASCRRRPDRLAPCTSPKDATWARRLWSVSALVATCIARLARYGSTANYPPREHPWRRTASRSAS